MNYLAQILPGGNTVRAKKTSGGVDCTPRKSFLERLNAALYRALEAEFRLPRI